MSTELETRMKEMEEQIVSLNKKALLLLATCIKHGAELAAITDIIEELVVDTRKDDMMASLADDIAKARSSHLN